MIYKRKNTLVRRKQIVSAVRKLIVNHGSEHITVRRVAREIGISEGAIYRHFKSKREVLSFLIDDIERTLMADFENHREPGLGMMEAIEKMVMSHISAIERRKGVSFQVIAEIVSLGDKKLNKKIYDVIARYTGCIRDILSEGVKAGVIRQDIDLDAAAALFFGMTQGLVNTWALSNYGFKLAQRYASIWSVFRQAVLKLEIKSPALV